MYRVYAAGTLVDITPSKNEARDSYLAVGTLPKMLCDDRSVIKFEPRHSVVNHNVTRQGVKS